MTPEQLSKKLEEILKEIQDISARLAGLEARIKVESKLKQK